MRAYKLLQEHQDILGVVAWIRSGSTQSKRFKIEEDFNPLVARSLFTRPTVKKDGFELDWLPVDQQGLKTFLTEKDFSTSRITNWLGKAIANERQ